MRDNRNEPKLTIATCQHAVSNDILTNCDMILKQIRIAKSNKANIVHFSECNLSGYAGFEFSDIKNQDKNKLQYALQKIKETARELNIWLIIGSHHFEKRQNKPHNSLYLINNHGIIVDRYDKRFLTGGSGEFDQKHYTAGQRPVVFKINGISCGLLICHEWRYPELYREYNHLKVKIIFQSFYDGSLSRDQYLKEGKELGELITGTMRGSAANNNLWISVSNTSNKESCFPGFVIQPDGSILKKLNRNRPGILVSKLDLGKKFKDPSGYWRKVILRKIIYVLKYVL